jgi:CTP synthase (UTP-ammonia lyase)
MTIALVGDYDEAVVAHRAIPVAIKLANSAERTTIPFEWLHSDEINIEELSRFSAFWCVPASPYANMSSVLKLIEHARVNNMPFLGTCGGYQHAALEYAQNALGYSQAENAEVNPETTMPLITTLSCKLHGVKDQISLLPGSFIRSIYASGNVEEEYNCGYGVNRNYLSIFEGGDLCFSGYDEDGDPRALEIGVNDFFVGTAFQPERSALSGIAHPLVRYFVKCATRA